MSPQELQLLGGMVMGWLVQQFMRAPKKVPAWLGYVAIAVVGTLVYVWITPDVMETLAKSWRVAVAGLVTFLFQVRGQASASSDAKLAKPTDSL